MKDKCPLSYRGYFGSYEVCFEDNVLHGKIEFINDLVTFEAESPEDLKREFEAAVDDYLETCEMVGKDPDKTMTGNFNVRIGEELHRKIAIEAIRRKSSINNTIIYALQCYFTSQEQVAPVRFELSKAFLKSLTTTAHSISVSDNTSAFGAVYRRSKVAGALKRHEEASITH